MLSLEMNKIFAKLLAGYKMPIFFGTLCIKK